jgi:rSAM/selenodomain-associated transferase 2
LKKLSVIVPVLNESRIIAATLARLQYLRSRGHELIVVDGGSDDATFELACALADRVLCTPRGRARQMNAGAEAASGDILLFLHADTQLPGDADEVLRAELSGDSGWGRFDVRLSGDHWLFRVIEWLMNRRSRLTDIATGDQAIFVTRDLFRRAGGFPEIELMEDIAFCARLRRIAKPLCLKQRVVTSSRRWEQAGIVRTTLKMWWLRLAYRLGVNPASLARWYDRA